MKTYSTSQVARLTGVHPNTVRFYEEIGFISPPPRRANGYRVYTELHLRQLALVRCALKGEVLQNGLRRQAVDVLRAAAAGEPEHGLALAHQYDAMLEHELAQARAAIAAVESSLCRRPAAPAPLLKRSEAAAALRVTVDTLRNWELNGLIAVKRRQNGYRVYDGADLERLRIIRTLRCANYSLSAILRLLNRLDGDEAAPVAETLNTPGDNEDIVSVCDRLILSLEHTREDAARMIEILKNIKTLQ